MARVKQNRSAVTFRGVLPAPRSRFAFPLLAPAASLPQHLPVPQSQTASRLASNPQKVTAEQRA